ncbi:NEDD4-binding protein 2 [Leptopilina heterotoma]|uniref:NEDD4-binding protein 2 n=1 Tax=Leptopilina heterotoma TaxID=63436 RepID=UPI001CA958B2|nr:NEDD4-binding protein 2 [Leptopilina heterotoma]XP_043479288.1 NEDD4-binding protein 2 [Leptopilina heterotoma]XP_043479289.1 NEDD4-binding protein 2 [Leptopilina heterotoma]
MSAKRDLPAEKSTKRSNKSRKNAAEYQERVLNQVREMFDSILEPDVILSVVQNCNWKLQPSIEYLISLSANINTSKESGSNFTNFDEDIEKEEEGAVASSNSNRNSSPEEDAFEVDTDFTYLNIDDEELQKQKDEFKRFELMRKHGQDCTENTPLSDFQDADSFFDNFFDNFASSMNKEEASSTTGSDRPGSSRQFLNQGDNLKADERRKTETESLCGLKVQYRFGGPEASSDDDADVVIEKESSNETITNPESTLTNVCQFLSQSTESSPKTTFPQVEMISTASPSSSPEKFKAGFNATQSRIKSTIQRGFKIMVIVRGLPGSGKTYLARSIAQLADEDNPAQFIFSTDDYFMKKGRIYDFDLRKLDDAHTFNQKRVLKAVTNGISPIIVDNTNTQCWEMKPYVIFAVKYGYFLEVLEPNTRWANNVNELTKRNIHNVPKFTIQKILERYEKNITAGKLLKTFVLKYDSSNTPPQPCSNDSLAKKKKETTENVKIKNIQRKNKIVDAEKKLEPHVPVSVSTATVVDSVKIPENENLTALQLALKTFGGEDDDLSPKANAQDLIQDKWDENGTSWEDEQQKMEINNQESNNLRETLNLESSSYRPFVLKVAENVMNVHEVNEVHSNLGAIGSERKNSFIKNSPPNSSELDNKNVLSQCWDFTLLLDGRQIHSVAPENENKSPNEEIDDSPENSTTSPSSIQSEKSPTEELKEAANDKDSPDSGTKSSTTESFEHIDSNSEDSSFEIRDLTDTKETTENEEATKNFETEQTNDDSEEKVSFGSIIKFIKKSFLGNSNKNLPDDSEIVIDSLSEKLHSPVKDHDYCKTKNLQYEHFSMPLSDHDYSKTSEDTETNSNKVKINLNDSLSKKLTEFSPDSPNNSHLVYESQGNFKCIDNEIEFQDSSESFVDISTGNEEKVLSNFEKLVSILSEPRENLETLGSKFDAINFNEENEKLILEEKEIPYKDGNIPETLLLPLENELPIKKKSEEYDNINAISWKESPFPIYCSEPPKNVEELKIIDTVEAGTNTDIYDFNVLFVGGTNEPGYKRMDVFNRSINEGQVPNFETPPPRKLKLDKSSMTDEVDILLHFPKENAEEAEIQGLIDMFPDISRDYIVDVFKNLCKGDSHWAIDLLLDGVPWDGIIKSKVSESPSSPTVRKSENSKSLNIDSNENGCQNRRKEKSLVTEDILALQKHLEEKVTMSEASYHPHTLRVRKWRNGEPDVSTEEIIKEQAKNKDFLQFASDSNSVSPTNSDENNVKEKDESDSDESSESDETMAFDLGWEFIKNLESQFGNNDFHMPDGLFPVIQLKKSLAQEIYALWIESMQQQMDDQQEQLDAMIAKDAEYAKSLEEAEAKAFNESKAPSLNEVMDMELALGVYKNDLKKQQARETSNDLASRLTRQMLNEMFPNFDPETLSEILKAHNGNFNETVEVLEASTGQSLSSTDALDKQNSIIAKLKQQSLSKEDSKSTKATSSKTTNSESNELTYEQVLGSAYSSRREAEREFSLRNENFNKAATAHRNGNPAVASYYSEMAKLHSKKMESANSAAASAFLAAQTHILGEENTLDLHNLFVPEALQALDIFLDHQLELLNSRNKRSVEILIVTGRGARSSNNKSKIKPAVSKRLTSRNIGFTEMNPGCLKVRLYRRNSST